MREYLAGELPSAGGERTGSLCDMLPVDGYVWCIAQMAVSFSISYEPVWRYATSSQDASDVLYRGLKSTNSECLIRLRTKREERWRKRTRCQDSASKLRYTTAKFDLLHITQRPLHFSLPTFSFQDTRCQYNHGRVTILNTSFSLLV